VVARWLALAALLACTLAWRLPASPPEWRFALCENDSLYQLHRVQQCLRDFPRVESIDSYSHYPRGYRVHWMPLHTLFYASLARLAGLPAEAREEIAALLSWVPPLLALASLLLVVGIARALTRNDLCVLAVALLYAFGADATRPFVYGTIDHHLFAHLGVLLMVWGRLRLRWWAWVAGAAALLAMTPEAIVYVTALLGCLFAALLAEELVEPGAVEPRRWPWLLAPGLVGLTAFAGGRALETQPLPPTDLTWMYPTAFTPLWLLVVGGAMLAGLRLAARVSPAAKVAGPEGGGNGRSGGERTTATSRPVDAGRSGRAFAAAVLAGAIVAAAAAAYLLATGALASVATRLLGGGDRLLVGEEASVFARGFFAAPAGYRMTAFALLWVAYRLIAAWRDRTDLYPARMASYAFGWLALALALLLGFAEYRHLYVLSSLQAVALGLAVFGVEERLRAMPLFARARFVPAVVLAAATVPFFLREDVAARAAASAGVCESQPLREELARWLAAHTPPAGRPPAYGVFAPWSIGHHLHVLADRPVVVDPFNYELDDWVGAQVRRVLHAGTTDEMAAALRDLGARYLVLTNPAAEIVDTLPAGADAGELLRRNPDGSVTYQPALARYAAFRLFMSGGAAAETDELRLLHASADAEPFTTGGGEVVAVARGQIYEVVAAPPPATTAEPRP